MKNENGALSYVFQYKDHLGNVRVSYAKNPQTQVLEIIEENNYYPFGLKHKGYNDYLPIANKYKYNGKELQDELGLNLYDYGARNYDPALGRWMNIDPLAEKSRRFNPYTYALDNPVFFIDPDGMAAIGNDDIITKVSNKRGDSHYVQRNVQMSMTLTVVNSKGVDLSKTMFNKSSGSVALNSMSGIAQKDYRGNDVSTSDNVSVSVNYKVVSSLKDVGKNDHVMMLVDNIPKGNQKVDPIGLAEKGGRVSAVEVGTIQNKTFDNTANHEIGHLLGLEHKNGGLMDPVINTSTSTSTREKGTVVDGQIGPFEGNGTYKQSERSNNYSAGIISQVNSFLNRNKIK
ncbi:RHS repeat domain-containing protein [Flavobacterium aquidurense]|uniref:RHS repeat domain-containing protein n=1 Tax=Flavobacterium aquidurense TaxID=362413 RepID=UPI0037180F81